eukprot:TRINITY_DN11637_c0_g1_i1.p1 TRINITY_DN11637_c0_g1~~TRINITY_DN11637_c0_g1_i1.p1  ORF type:complete len:298 (-),score=19.69 TRINITY_DN11637_c0_g1_i1:49-897(-)
MSLQIGLQLRNPLNCRQIKQYSRFICQATKPARTCGEAVQQARLALRRFRELEVSESSQNKLIVQLPLPSTNQDDDLVRIMDEGDWPGGILQKFRVLKGMCEELLFGYESEFVGMLESELDGIGVWRTEDMTIVANVTNATFKPFSDLCFGKYGQGPTRQQEILLAVNPTWTSYKDIGQLWDRQLKQRAQDIIEGYMWQYLYYLKVVRTAAGSCGILFRTFPEDWYLYEYQELEEGENENGNVSSLGKVLLQLPEKPSKETMIEKLNSTNEKQKSIFGKFFQ